MTVHIWPFPVPAFFATALILMLGAAAPSALAQEKASAEHQSPRGPNDGIKVHGHWTLDITNADGTPASHHEFENALLLGGGASLSALLAHQQTFLGWSVFLRDTTNLQDYVLAEPQVASAYGSPVDLAVAINSSKQLALQGSVTPLSAASISEVTSQVFTQTGSSTTQFGFSGRVLSPAIAVAAGQTVQVTVVFTFS
jgi:hypothetical protein